MLNPRDSRLEGKKSINFREKPVTVTAAFSRKPLEG